MEFHRAVAALIGCSVICAAINGVVAVVGLGSSPIITVTTCHIDDGVDTVMYRQYQVGSTVASITVVQRGVDGT